MNSTPLTEEQQLRNQVEWLQRDIKRKDEDIEELYNDLRARFAMAALTGILACFRDHEGSETIEERVATAFKYADAMMSEMKRRREK